MPRKGENIYKRKDGRWEARYIKGYSAEGKALYGSCYARTYKDVREKLFEAKEMLRMNEGQLQFSKSKFGDICNEWLLLNRNKVKESTYVKYMGMINKHILPNLGKLRITEITTMKIEQFSNELLNKKGLSTKTVRDILTILRTVLLYLTKAHQWRMPYVEIVFPKESKKEMRVLTRNEQERLIKYLVHDMDECRFGVLLALYTGLRIGEIFALKWKDVSTENKTLSVRATVQRIKDLDRDSQNKTKLIIDDPKTYTSARVIPLTEYIAKLCENRRVRDEESYVLTGTRELMEPRLMQYRIKKITAECGLAGVHFHTLRHTFATRCVEVGFELKSLSEILGHASPKITLERYVHSSIELKRENMNKLTAIGF